MPAQRITFFIAVRKDLYYNTENQKQLGMMSMTKILEFLKKQPLVTALAALAIAAVTIMLPQDNYVTRDIWAIGLVHGLYDFLCTPSLLLGKDVNIGAGNYVVEGDMGKVMVIGYAVQIAISGIITLMVWKKVGKTINFEEIRENW